MFKHNEKNDIQNRKSIRIPDILKQSRQKNKPKSSVKHQYSQSCDYDTDGKKPNRTNSRGQAQQLRAIMESCTKCMGRISQFTTKKPSQPTFDIRKSDRWTQTTQKPFLLDLIQERVQQVCLENSKLSKLVSQKQEQLADRQQQIVEIEDKFTNILYVLGQDFSQLKIVNNDLHLVRNGVQTDSQVPSYLKAMLMDQN